MCLADNDHVPPLLLKLIVPAGQKRREKIAALEAQARALTPPHLSVQTQPGTAQFEPVPTTHSSTKSTSDDFDTIEDIMRQTDVTGLPEMHVDFGQDPIDMQLFGDLSQSLH
jgi:hypothetical protein